MHKLTIAIISSIALIAGAAYASSAARGALEASAKNGSSPFTTNVKTDYR